MRLQIYRFRVRGTSRFPLDMLRHGQAWPESNEDVQQIERIDQPFVREIRLCAIECPDFGRWISFGWRVNELDNVRVK